MAVIVPNIRCCAARAERLRCAAGPARSEAVVAAMRDGDRDCGPHVASSALLLFQACCATAPFSPLYSHSGSLVVVILLIKKCAQPVGCLAAIAGQRLAIIALEAVCMAL